MIVVDANVIVYFTSPFTANLSQAAYATRARDPDWHASALWRTEVASALLGMMRRRQVAKGHIIDAWREANDLRIVEHPLAGSEILPFALRYNLSAYDAQYVQLAMNLGCHLITADKGVLSNCAPYAVALESFAAGEALPRLPS